MPTPGFISAWRSRFNRLLVSAVGINVVDFHRIWRNFIHDKTASEDMTTTDGLSAGIIPYGASARDLDIIRFSDLLTANLVSRTQLKAPILALENDKNIMEKLERITTSKGHYTYATTAQKQKTHGRSTGTSAQQNCIVCRKYLNVRGKVSYMKTSFCCKICKISSNWRKRNRTLVRYAIRNNSTRSNTESER